MIYYYGFFETMSSAYLLQENALTEKVDEIPAEPIMIIRVLVKPRSDRDHIIKISENEYKVLLRAAAEDNKASISLIKLLGKYFHVPQRSIRIVSGLKCKEKIVEIE